ncbi:MAG: peptidoglycan editing factor PgeF [Mariprofundaceae bacterium]|nr:peptidoglycan editing factor PgeF [Mariprofundaceae bacterium]
MFIRSSIFEQHHMLGIFSTRQGGISPPPFEHLNLGLDLGDSSNNIQENLRRLCQASHIPLPHRSIQTHGIKTMICQGKGIQHQHDADILITTTPNTSVAVRTADCLPILLLDKHANIAAAVHAGWRGTAKNIVHIAIQNMQARGAKPEHILASLGPCIGSCCFEAGLQAAQQLAASHPQAHQHLHDQKQKFYPDLQAINQCQLISSGIKKQHIEIIRQCTYCQSHDFFSWRRDQQKSGRMLAIVQCPTPIPLN